ncbi:hypothetical protein GLE_1442 [Lysobacter enzymogenes]|uniref:Uncharacterized protein n=1 Tax=Lysobacter enzymogenes TaxID=69 RepID=A0A0S2DER4_LYSEN|nr:hypothetical protein GLE_1442 [Lysobacter enzymogenes]
MASIVPNIGTNLAHPAGAAPPSCPSRRRAVRLAARSRNRVGRGGGSVAGLIA